MILILSHRGDPHALAVMERLAAWGAPHLLFDTGSYPKDARIALKHGTGKLSDLEVTLDGETTDLNRVRAAWWRRPQPFNLDPALTDPENVNFAFNEAHAAATGLWSSLDAQWINEPDRDERAARKTYQLKLAAELGLTIPETLITNNPDEARAFVAKQGERGTIYKAFSATEQAWRETRLLKPEEHDLLDAVVYAPVIFQEHIAADIDLRITVIGDQLFPCAIHSGKTSYKVDFRMTMHQADMVPHTLPPAVEADLLKIMRALGLVYGAIDMRLTPDGRYVFIEVNPAGQWLFVEERTKQPITDALAAKLVELSRE